MPENFPGIEQDCQDVIRRCNALILAARACKAQVAMGSREGIRTQVQAMDKQAEELQRDLQGATVTRVGEGIKITFDSGLLFAVDKSDLNSTAVQNVNELGQTLLKYEDTDILIEGHTDADGADDYNLGLSERRAKSVSRQLIADGVQAGRISTVGYGEGQPVADNGTAEGKAQNRRVEVAIYANKRMQKAAERGEL